MDLHQVWLGPKAPPLQWMNSWRETNPEFTYRLWTDSDVRDLHLENAHLFKRLVGIGRFDGASDVLRAELLYRFGGVYVDADSLALRPLTGARFLEDALFVMQEPTPVQEGLLNGCFMGACCPRSPALAAYIEAMRHVHAPLAPTWKSVGPVLLTKVLAQFEVTKLPPWVFFTRTLAGERVEGAENAYGEHYWSSTTSRRAFPGGVPWPK